jgi:hypothetical protein
MNGWSGGMRCAMSRHSCSADPRPQSLGPNGRDRVEQPHLLEAIQGRSLDRNGFCRRHCLRNFVTCRRSPGGEALLIFRPDPVGWPGEELRASLRRAAPECGYSTSQKAFVNLGRGRPIESGRSEERLRSVTWPPCGSCSTPWKRKRPNYHRSRHWHQSCPGWKRSPAAPDHATVRARGRLCVCCSSFALLRPVHDSRSLTPSASVHSRSGSTLAALFATS